MAVYNILRARLDASTCFQVTFLFFSQLVKEEGALWSEQLSRRYLLYDLFHYTFVPEL